MNSKLFVLVVFLFTFAACMPAADDKVIESMYLPKLHLYRFYWCGQDSLTISQHQQAMVHLSILSLLP